jgi:hypothetical protein
MELIPHQKNKPLDKVLHVLTGISAIEVAWSTEASRHEDTRHPKGQFPDQYFVEE